MKVPTYKSQTRRSNISGAEQLSVRANPGAFSQAADASLAFSQTAQRASLNALQNAQKEQLLAFEQQQEKDLLEFEIDKKTTYEQEKNNNLLQFKKEIADAAIQAKTMDANKAVTFFDNKKEDIIKSLNKNFTSKNAFQDFILDSESDYIHKRISVKSDAMNRKINAQAATSVQLIDQYKTDVIYGNEAESNKAQNKIFGKGGLYDKLVELGYYTETEAATKSAALKRDILEEKTIEEFNNQSTIQGKSAFIQNLKDNPLKPLGPGKNRQLVKKFESDLNNQLKINDGKISELIKDYKQINKILTDGGTVDLSVIEALEGKSKQLNDAEGLQFARNLKVKKTVYDDLRRQNPSQIQDFLRDFKTGGVPNFGEEGLDTTLETEILKEATQIANNMRTELARDPLNFAAGTGLIKINQLDFTSASFETEVSNRIQAAQNVSTIYGTELTYLTEAETQIFTSFFSNKNITKPERLAMLSRISQGFGRHTSSVLKELSQKGSPNLAHIGGLVLKGNVTAASKALDGLDLRNAGIKVDDSVETDLNATFKDTVKTALRFFPSEVQGATYEVSKLIYNSIQSEEGQSFFRANNFEKAIKLALGGKITKGGTIGGVEDVNGTPTYIPEKLNADQLENMLDNITSEDITRITGLNLSPGVIKDINDEKYDLYATGDGVYFLAIGEGDDIRILADRNGIKIKLNALSYYGLSGDEDS